METNTAKANKPNVLLYMCTLGHPLPPPYLLSSSRRRPTSAWWSNDDWRVVRRVFSWCVIIVVVIFIYFFYKEPSFAICLFFFICKPNRMNKHTHLAHLITVATVAIVSVCLFVAIIMFPLLPRSYTRTHLGCLHHRSLLLLYRQLLLL